MSGPSPPGNLLAMPPASPEPGEQPADPDGPDSPPLSSSRALRNVARQFVGAYYRDLNVAPSALNATTPCVSAPSRSPRVSLTPPLFSM